MPSTVAVGDLPQVAPFSFLMLPSEGSKQCSYSSPADFIPEIESTYHYYIFRSKVQQQITIGTYCLNRPGA